MTKKHIFIFVSVILMMSVIIDYFNIFFKYTTIEPIIGYFSFFWLSALASFFLRQNKIFLSWIKFLLFFLPLSFWFIWVNRTGGMLSPGAEGAAIIMGMVLFLVSISLFAIKSWEFRRFDHGMPIKQWLKWFLLVLGFIASIALSIFIYGFIQ